MEGDVITKIQKIADEAREIKIIDGESYSPVSLQRVYSDPRPTSIKVHSLSGIIDYLVDNIDNLANEKLFIQVVNHLNVIVYSNIHGPSNERHAIIKAEFSEYEPFRFDEFIEQENFIVQCKSMFETTPDMEAIIKYTAKIDTEATIRTEDDGITQNINIKKGVSGVKTERGNIPSLVKLKPFRTFPEVEQPESNFLFRIKNIEEKVYCSLFKADGGAWKNVARQNIRKYFDNNLKDTSVIA